jgi:hypothetical protein
MLSGVSSRTRERAAPERLPYAGINRIRFEGLISGRDGHP